MSRLNSLQDLFIDELKDVYHAENQITKALPKMAAAATSPELKAAFETHLQETQNQIKRLEQVFKTLNIAPQAKPCKAMQGIIAEGEEMMSEDAKPTVMDAALISSAQRVEHYEITGYGTLRTFAQELGNEEAARLLQETLDEERATDEKLTKLAETRVNSKAIAKEGALR